MKIPTAAVLFLAACDPAWGAFQIVLPQTEPPPASRSGAAEPQRQAPLSPPPARLGPPPDAAGSECTAFVRSGDSLAILARRHLGDSARWREIQQLNHIRNPDLIGAGWTLAIPCNGPAGTASPGKPLQRPRRDPRDPPEPVPEAVAEPAARENAAAEAGQVAETVAGILEEIGSDATGEPLAPEPTGAHAPDRAAAATSGMATGSPAAAGPPSEEPQPIVQAPPEVEGDSPVHSNACSVTVASGDSLAILARRHLGDAARWPEIRELNGIPNPDLISVGQQLLLPCSPAAADAGQAARAESGPTTDGEGRSLSVAAIRPWTGLAGERLDDVISRWAIAAGWTPIITERWSWELDTDVTVSGTFIEGVKQLLGGFSSSGTAPGVAVYANQVLVLEYR